MDNAIYQKNNEKLEEQNQCKTSKSEKFYLRCTSKPSFISHEMFNNNLVAIQKSIVALKLIKTAYIGMCLLELSKVLMCEFHYDYNKGKCDQK